MRAVGFMLRRANQRVFSFSLPIPRSLHDCAKIPLMNKLSPVELSNVWTQQYLSNPRVHSESMTASDYDQLSANLARSTMFLSPCRVATTSKSPLLILPSTTKTSSSTTSTILLVSQLQDKMVMFTYLEQYRANAANAPPYLIVGFYEDFKNEKDKVLMRMDVVAPDIEKVHAINVWSFFKEMYLTKYHEVEKFNHKPQEFDFDEFKLKNSQFW